MKELNLEVGQKVWSIQSGECKLIDVNKDEEYCFITENKDGRRNCYNKFGRYGNEHFSPSLFESNPFEQKLVQESKAELINALCNARNAHFSGVVLETINNKLQKLLESL